jgi:hypothetical protein
MNSFKLKQTGEKLVRPVDPTRTPPGAWIGLISTVSVKLVISTPIAVEINDFQIL